MAVEKKKEAEKEAVDEELDEEAPELKSKAKPKPKADETGEPKSPGLLEEIDRWLFEKKFLQ
jgi:hypothetical protein